MKGIFNLRPPKARYSHIWDVTVLFEYLKSLGPNEHLSLKLLTLKLVTLVAITTGERCHAIALMNISCVQAVDKGLKFMLETPTKTSKPGGSRFGITIIAYPYDPLLCVMSALKLYLVNTKLFRGSKKRLF